MKRFLKLEWLLGAALVGVTAVAFASAPAHAYASSESVTLDSKALIERTEIDKTGRERTVLKSPSEVVIVPGDKVVFTLKYTNRGAEPANGFRATNPMPAPVQFVAVAEDWAEVSVDGGTSWGKLSTLTVRAKSADGTGEVTRGATPADVTHVRWVLPNAIAPGGEGSLSYRGIIK